ncbi:MAG: ABC transporter permease [Bacteroidota bacterium]
MLRSYITIALRRLFRNKLYSSINIIGLSLGMASVILLVLHVRDELSYDQYHAHAKEVYRIVQEQRFTNGTQHLATTSAPVAPALAKDYPEVIEATRLAIRRNTLISKDSKKVSAETIAYADSNIFQVLSFSFIKGNAQTALIMPKSLVLTQSMAYQLFADEEPLGKTLKINNGEDYLITGIIQDMPSASHLKASALASLSTFENSSWIKNIYSSSVYTYVRLSPQAEAKAFGQKLLSFVRKFRSENGEEDNSGMILFHLQALTDIHLHSDMVQEIQPNGNATAVYILPVVAAIILLLACLNYIILAVASYTRRMKEVGLRKTVGAYRSQLILQFWLESACMMLFVFFVALFWIVASLPFFNQITGKHFTLSTLAGFTEAGSLCLLLIFVSALASAYPAWFVSRFQVKEVLRDTLTIGRSNFSFRNALITFQFSISIALIVAVLVIYQQMQYVQNKQLGFNKEYLINLKVRSQPGRASKIVLLKQELAHLPHVIGTAASTHIVGDEWFVEDVRLPNAPFNETRNLRVAYVDSDYFQTLQLKMVAGRSFSSQLASDTSRAFIINEAAVTQFGWRTPQEALGKELQYYGNAESGRFKEPVIGVVRDFHYASLHQEIEPLIILCWPSATTSLLVRVHPETHPEIRPASGMSTLGNPSQTLAEIERAWNKIFPDYPFEYTFGDESLAALYQSDERMNHLLLLFSGLAISIACLGLFGLTTFTAQQRTKEIGIRKVLGASVSSIVALLSKDFLTLVVLANLVAWPSAWWAMNHWLQDFAYRIELSGWVLLIAGAVALLLAWLTVSAQAIKAARANPVQSLRTE